MTEVTTSPVAGHKISCLPAPTILTPSTDQSSVHPVSLKGAEDLSNSNEGEIMNGKKHQSRANVLLFVLFGITLVCLVDMIGETGAPHPGAGVHFHAFAGFVMTVATFFHIRHHRRWFMAAVKGKLKGRALVRLVMNTTVFTLMIVACLSGFDAMRTQGITPFHAIAGSGAALGLMIHCVRKLRSRVKSAQRRNHRLCGATSGYRVNPKEMQW